MVTAATLKLTIYRSTFNKTTITACNSYNWPANGVTYLSTGIYIYNYTNSSGCASADTLKLTINQSTFNTSTVSSCGPYTWSANGLTYSSSGTYTRAYANGNLCSSVDTLKLTVLPNSNSTTRSTACGSYAWVKNGATYYQSGTYLTSYPSCGTADTLILTIIQQLTPTFTQIAPICQGGTFTLPTTSTNGITGTWSPAINNQTTITYTFAPAAGACVSTTVVTMTVTVKLKTTSTTNQTICSTSLPYVWNGYTITTSGTYLKLISGGNSVGCDSTATLVLSVTQALTPTFNQVLPICQGGSFVLPTTSTNGISGSWSPSINNQATTIYTFTPTAGQCATTTTMTVSVNPTIVPIFNQITAICKGSAFTLPTTSTNGITGIWTPAINNQTTTTYTFTPTAGQCATNVTMTVNVNAGTSTSTNQSACGSYTWSVNGQTYTASGTYINTLSCGRDTLKLTISPKVVPTFTQVAPICKGGSFSLPTTSNNGITGTWAPVINNQAITTYTFTPSTGICATTATMTVTVNQPVVPLFTQIAPINSCQTFDLPNISVNGITGTWSPVINNQATTTYTFTPSTGICATTATMTVTISSVPCGPSTYSSGTLNTPIPPGGTTPTCYPITVSGLSGLGIIDVNYGVASVCINIDHTWVGDLRISLVAPDGTSVLLVQDDVNNSGVNFTGTCFTAAATVPISATAIAPFTGDYLAAQNLGSVNNGQSGNGVWTLCVLDTYDPSDDGTMINWSMTFSGTPAPPPTLCINTSTTVSSCSSYTWSATAATYTSSGIYLRSYTNTCGTSSVDTLKLTIQQPVTPTFTQISAICVGGSFTLPANSNNGITGSWLPAINNQTTTIYTFAPTAGQCATTATMTVAIKQPTISTTTTSVCANALPYVWNGVSYTSSGSYSKIFTGGNSVGCDSTAILTLTVVNASNTSSTVSSCNSYTWNTVIYTTSGTYTRANNCGTDTLKLTIKRSTTSTSTASVCSNALPYLWNGVSYTSSGSYTKVFTAGNVVGCDSTAYLTLTVVNTSNTSTTASSCNSYTWNTITYTSSGTYTRANTCGTDTLKLTIKKSTTSTTSASVCSNALPYVWNGVSYTSSGSYSKIFTGGNSVGCDSTAILTLTVVNASNTSSTVSSCNSYTWNTVIYTTSGTYTRANNCGTDTLKLTIKRSTTSTSTASVCSNALPYVWNGVSYTSTGTYTKVFVGGNKVGCDSTAHLVLTVVTTSNTSSTVSSCNSYLWNNTTYTTSGTYTRTTSCGTDTLKLTIKKSTSSTSSVAVCSNTLPYLWNGLSYTSSGTYSKLFVGGNKVGCDSTAIVILSIKNTTSSSTTVSVCSNLLPYVWNGVSYTSSGSYSKVIVGGNKVGCDSTAYLTLLVKNTTTSRALVSVCTSALPYVWNGSNYSTSGVYTKVFPLGNAVNCDSTALLDLTVSQSSNLIQSGIIGNKNISKCDTLQTYSVAAIAGVTYNWTVTGTGNYIRSGKGTNVIIAVMKVAGTVSVSATNSCSATASTATFSVIKSTPTTPGTIYQKISPVLVTANTNACLFNQIAFASTGQADTFMIKSVANVKGYLWKVPVGSILNRINDTTIAVVFSNSIVLPDTIKVYAYADCDTSLARALPLTKTLPATPGVMYKSFNANSTTGPAAVTSVCNLVGGGSEIYMIRKIATATSYNWSLKIGTYAVITHLNPLGVNDTAIRVTYNTGFAKDTIVVKSVNGCGISTSRILAVSAIYTPPAVTAIAGSTTPCIGNVITYIASSTVPTATQSSISVYRWTKPNYTTIISASLDSFSITLQYNTGFTGGSIIAKGQSACGVAGTAKTITLQYLPPTPTSITSSTGLYNACIGNVITYTVVVPAPSTTQRAAVAYRWTKPNYTTIVSSSTDSSTITVSFNVGYIGGSLTAKGQTVCGVTGTAKTQALTHSTCPVGTKATPYVITESSNLFDVQLFPNPSTTGFNLKVMSSSKEMTTVKIVDLQGRVVKTFLSNPSNEKLIGQDLKAGFYLIEVSQGVDKKTIRAVKF